MAPRQNDAYEQHRQKIHEVARRYHGFNVWVTRDGVPMATRTGTMPAVVPPGWAMTLMSTRVGDWPDLEAQLSEQARIDELAGV